MNAYSKRHRVFMRFLRKIRGLSHRMNCWTACRKITVHLLLAPTSCLVQGLPGQLQVCTVEDLLVAYFGHSKVAIAITMGKRVSLVTPGLPFQSGEALPVPCRCLASDSPKLRLTYLWPKVRRWRRETRHSCSSWVSLAVGKFVLSNEKTPAHILLWAPQNFMEGT